MNPISLWDMLGKAPSYGLPIPDMPYPASSYLNYYPSGGIGIIGTYSSELGITTPGHVTGLASQSGVGFGFFFNGNTGEITAAPFKVYGSLTPGNADASSFVAGASGGFGVGGFVTNAGTPQGISGDFNQANINTPVGVVSVGTSNGITMSSAQYTPPLVSAGLSDSNYTTTTVLGPTFVLIPGASSSSDAASAPAGAPGATAPVLDASAGTTGSQSYSSYSSTVSSADSSNPFSTPVTINAPTMTLLPQSNGANPPPANAGSSAQGNSVNNNGNDDTQIDHTPIFFNSGPSGVVDTHSWAGQNEM